MASADAASLFRMGHFASASSTFLFRRRASLAQHLARSTLQRAARWRRRCWAKAGVDETTPQSAASTAASRPALHERVCRVAVCTVEWPPCSRNLGAWVGVFNNSPSSAFLDMCQPL
ncbi:hypothetical protein IQ06DRAFT_114671 [Phaeosphaeriaceae sp. SRC1lsM3a]|nr:hypothetical protein IQ06DRAFT_114671 [Stagonospora sp. SRC1lsM3a]